MPELPEVETVVRDLNRLKVIGKTIKEVEVNWEKTISPLSAVEFKSKLIGKNFSALERKGKYLVFSVNDGQTLLIHLRMSGSLYIRNKGEKVSNYERLVICFDDEVLAFHDPRKFGRALLTKEPSTVLNKLGLEPFNAELTGETFYKMLHSKKKVLKALLLDQSFIAGIGNIYADEILFDSKLNPLRLSDSLTKDESLTLLKSMRKLLSNAIENRGTSLGDGLSNFKSDGLRGNYYTHLAVFKKDGQKCPNCSAPIEKIKVAQRTTHYCPTCQK